MQLRLAHEQFLQGAEKQSLFVYDNYFAEKQLRFNTFTWGNGEYKLLITHGWGSKAADFLELITALIPIKDIQIIAFDAPGNGSSEGELSNLILYELAIKAIISNYGPPDIIIGHSLGAMANIIAVMETHIMPLLMISITPLVKLKENFAASMDAVNIPPVSQSIFFEAFKSKFGVPASNFDLDNFYELNPEIEHWLFYDPNDIISPYAYLKEFLNNQKLITAKNYDGLGHDKIIRSPIVINAVVDLINSTLKN
ncbi:alpha/beta hydrolase [Mucilaginibacter sp. UR6-1]|uniref:alpha/beta hydrolase n=1 Tax=Mucilaginibacter sp. UR6-1 TaxID=1435643 RepID=UPI001E488B65|nr:alpha/beta hydrolase [Mucilaginibacter sp. UR6-1]MCC8409442.1 alpha/beta hydrolase [Mucilaginibacter sp. UR6-1]